MDHVAANPEPVERLVACLDRHADALVMAYFDADLPFSGDTFDTLGDNPPTIFVRDDFLALTCLDESVPPRTLRWLLGAEGKAVMSPLLTAVPVGTKLGSGDDERALAAAQPLWDALQIGHGIGPTKAGKLLARKRPDLVPIVDSVVASVVGASAGRYWGTYHVAMSDPAVTGRLHELRRDAGSPRVSLLRILDVAVWMRGSRSNAAEAVRTIHKVRPLPWLASQRTDLRP